MAGHVINPATKFEDPPSILSWITSYNVPHRLPLKMRTAAILFYANYKVKTQNSAWKCIQHAWIMLKRLVTHFYPKMHLDDYWRPFFRNASRLCVSDRRSDPLTERGSFGGYSQHAQRMPTVDNSTLFARGSMWLCGCSLPLSSNLLCCRTGLGWLGSRVVSVMDSGAEGLGSNLSRDAVG